MPTKQQTIEHQQREIETLAEENMRLRETLERAEEVTERRYLSTFKFCAGDVPDLVDTIRKLHGEIETAETLGFEVLVTARYHNETGSVCRQADCGEMKAGYPLVIEAVAVRRAPVG